MKSSYIVDYSRQPANPAGAGVYQSKDKDTLDALIRNGVDPAVFSGARKDDTSIYEFPGDATYARYLSGGNF